MSEVNHNLEPCFECGGEHRHVSGCALDHAGGFVERGGKFIVRSAMGEYWLAAAVDGPYIEFYKTPTEALAAAIR